MRIAALALATVISTPPASFATAEPTQESVVSTSPPEWLESYSPVRFVSSESSSADKFAQFLFAGREIKATVSVDYTGGIAFALDRDGDGEFQDSDYCTLTKSERGMTCITDVSRDGEIVPIHLTIPEYGSNSPECLLIRLFAVRHAHATLADNTKVALAIVGSEGNYLSSTAFVCVDANLDGVLETAKHADECVPPGSAIAVRQSGLTVLPSRDGSRIELSWSSQIPYRWRIDPGNQLPDAEFVDMNGTLRRLSEFRGRPLLIYGWATWCGQCMNKTPELHKLAEDGPCPIQVLGVPRRESVDYLKTYFASGPLPWPQAFPGPTDDLVDLLRISGLPVFLLVDSDGTILLRTRSLDAVKNTLANEVCPRAESSRTAPEHSPAG